MGGSSKMTNPTIDEEGLERLLTQYHHTGNPAREWENSWWSSGQLHRIDCLIKTIVSGDKHIVIEQAFNNHPLVNKSNLKQRLREILNRAS